MMLPSSFFEVHEWDPLNATHRFFVRNALIAQIRLHPMREKVGNKFIHSLRNVYLLSEDGKIDVQGTKTGSHDPRTAPSQHSIDSHIKGHVLAVTVFEIPRQDMSLLDLLEKTGPLPEAILGSIAVQLVSIIEHLHVVCGCIHNDIDARNIYINANSGTIRISSFFFSQFPKRAPGSDMKAHTNPKVGRFVGPLLHQSPERMLGLECSFPADIYSLGYMLRLLVTGEYPVSLEQHQIKTTLSYKSVVVNGSMVPLKVHPSAYIQTNSNDLQSSVGKQLGRVHALHRVKKMLENASNEWKQEWRLRCSRFDHTTPATYYSKELSELVEACMQKNPAKRLTAVELCDHPFLIRCKLTMGLSVELKAFLKMQKCKINGITSERDYDAF
jgi:serine/threonine protein kinase